MPEIFIHERESDLSTESFLNENREKFSSDAKFLLSLLYRGKRLSNHQVTKDFGIDGRRLRELILSHKEIKKEWVLNDKGKRMYVEYFMEIPKQTTKSDLQQWWNEFQSEKPAEKFYQPELNF